MFTRATTSALFPVYLLPSIPFHRRKTSTDSTDSATSDSGSSTAPTKGTLLHGDGSHLQCAKCQADICFTSQIISKGFTGRHGRAYLVSPSPTPAVSSQTASGAKTPCLPNTKTDTSSQRQLVTGIHTVSDVRCALCSSMLGWKYDGAEEESQKYKVGKYILETKMVCSASDWEHGELSIPFSSVRPAPAIEQRNDPSNIEFDSQDEDECEDLFAGVWSPALASKRRQNKNFRRAVLSMEARAR